MDIKQILSLSPEEISKLVDAGDISEFIILSIPLDNALVAKQYDVAGNYIALFEATDVNTNVDIEFNRTNSGSINFTQGLKFKRPFNRFFITADAQAGKTVKLLVSSFNPLFELQDDRSNNLTASYLAEIQEQLQGSSSMTMTADNSVTTVESILSANTDRHAFLIQADITNTDLIYIGTDNTTTSSKKIASLAPGDAFMLDDYLGAIWAISASGTQKVSVSEW